MFTFIWRAQYIYFISYMSRGTYGLTSTSSDRFLRNFFMAAIFALSFCQKTALFSYFVFMCDLGYTPNTPTHYLDYGDFQHHLNQQNLFWSEFLFGNRILMLDEILKAKRILAEHYCARFENQEGITVCILRSHT